MLEKRKNLQIKFYIIAVIILLIFLHYTNILAWPESFAYNLWSGLQNKTYVFLTKLKYSFVNFQAAQNLKKENIELKQELNQLHSDSVQFAACKLDNDQLRSLLNFSRDKEVNSVLADVIGWGFDRENTFLINKGISDGLAIGFPVIVDNGIILGKIIEVKNNIASVLLLTDKLSQLAVSTPNSTKSIGMANGDFGLSIKVELIPQDFEIKEGDLVITSGLEKYVPRGLILGKVNRIISRQNDLFKSATISPAANYDEATIVAVVIPKNYSND